MTFTKRTILQNMIDEQNCEEFTFNAKTLDFSLIDGIKTTVYQTDKKQFVLYVEYKFSNESCFLIFSNLIELKKYKNFI